MRSLYRFNADDNVGPRWLGVSYRGPFPARLGLSNSVEEDPRLNCRQGYLIVASSFWITLHFGAEMVIAKQSPSNME